jgi:hypothetical protein
MTFFLINPNMTAHPAGPGPELARVGANWSHMTTWNPLYLMLLLPAMVGQSSTGGRKPEGAEVVLRRLRAERILQPKCSSSLARN